MNRSELLNLFKFYKESEEQNPYAGKDSLKAKWWEGERMFLKSVESDPGFFDRVKDNLIEAQKEGYVSGYLADNDNSLESRTIVFYLDLWNGKWFPNDSLDDIIDYIKTE